MAERGGYFSEKIDAGVTSDAHFNAVSSIEGPNLRNLRYIEDQTRCKVSVHGTGHVSDGEDGLIHVLVIADTEEDLKKAKELVSNLIATVKAQKQRAAQAKAAKRAKRKKSGKAGVSLPDQLIAAMNVYFPGEEDEPPPPGSPGDAKIHRTNFRSAGRSLGWFTG